MTDIGTTPISDEGRRGLYEKYHVKRLNDTGGKHDNCYFFVLDLDHDKHARPALWAYAESCEAEYPELAKDLRAAIYDNTSNNPTGEPGHAEIERLPSQPNEGPIVAALRAWLDTDPALGRLEVHEWLHQHAGQSHD